MSITAKALIDAKYAANSDNSEYTSPALGKGSIIDKFTATNNDTGSQTLTVNIIPNAGSVGASNIIVAAVSISAGATFVSSELQNHILNSGDQISCKASVASKIVIRASGREVS